jgi:hypothetical protein
MKKFRIIIIMIVLLGSSGAYSQYKNKSDNQNNVIKSVNDYRVLSSSNTSVELEYTPVYTGNSDFINSFHNSNDYGKPDIPSRNFPVMTPSDRNNTADIMEITYEEIQNVDIKPIPTPKRADNKLEVIYDFKYDSKIYTANKNYPETNLSLIKSGILRNKYISIIKINPILYNPLTRVVKRIKSIKIRVTFGDNPLYVNKTQSRVELDFLRGLALNWENAKNWSTPEFNKKPLIQNSVLASGDFFKIEVRENGMYRIDKNFLTQAGINVNNIDPRTIKIYGNGGAELPYNNSISVPTDLVENSIYVEGESDGVFNDNDYIVFYGQSPNQWNYTSANKYTHSINHYSTTNYYWITYGGANGRRMQNVSSQNVSGLTPLQSFTDKFFEEPEANNLGSTGTLWVSPRIGYGDGFVFNRELKGYVSGSDITLTAVPANGTLAMSFATFLVKDDNSNFSTLVQIPDVNSAFSHINLLTPALTATYQLYPGQTSINLKMSLPQQYNVSTVSAYYDYIELLYQRSFGSVSGNYLRFSSPDTSGIMEYQVSTFSSSTVKLFRINNYNTIDLINPISYSNGVLKFQDNNTPGVPIDYYAVGDLNYMTPVSISQRVPNQNIKGNADGADYIIISPTEFLSAANNLKTIRENGGPSNPSYLKTLVIDVNQIYNEFSGGLLDPVAMRNFLKYTYFNWTTRPVYVLFLGDGSYDYKNIYGLATKNFMPPIEKSSPNMDEIASYNSDDFITEINENNPSPDTGVTDFANGRFCVNSLSDANIIVDKISQYESGSNNGIWKKKIMYCADDGWTTEQNQGQEGDMHTRQCESIAEDHTPKDFEKEKIYIVAYPTVITPQGRRKPGANVDIIKGWNEGRLLVNWTGHGSTDLWAHEHVFVKDESIPQLHNKGKYPVVTIASCDLARWDDPYLISAAEKLVLIQDAGGIGVIAATRPVYANYNERLNNYLWDNLMSAKDTLNLPIRIGKALYNVKNQISGIVDNDMKYCLIGDPAMRISIPQYFTKIDSINNISGNDTAIVKALQKVKISGSVLRPDSSFWSNYNGDIVINVFDVDRQIYMIDFNMPFGWRLDGGTIYKGSTKVTNGKWSLEFIVPKDISYNTGTGKILAYFGNGSSEGSGYSNMFKLTGLDTTAVADTTGPVISLYMDSRNFKTGDLVNQNAKIIADFYDASGINLTGAIGHKIESIVNNDDNSKIDLTSYYNSTSGYQYGSLEYPLTGLADGNYTLKLKAWDTYNNASESSITFVVKSTQILAVNNVFNYPNPMTDGTAFTFQHNFDMPLTTQIDVYTVAGRKIKTIKRTNIISKFVSIEWDGRDEDGDYIANGTYIYKVIVKTEDGSFSKVQTGKLVKLK